MEAKLNSGKTGNQSGDMSPIIISAPEIAMNATVRPLDGHKGTFGTLLIDAGSPGMGGATYLCCEAALRSGIGLARLFIPEELMSPLLELCPHAISVAASRLPEERMRRLKKLSATSDAVVFGPGLDPEADGIEYDLLYLIENVPNLILDASAITIIAGHREIMDPVFMLRAAKNLPPVILTPHPGEFLRLVPGWDKSERRDAPGNFARHHKLILVLKGHETAVFTPRGVWYINSTGNDGMAKGGSGDVLAGLIGGFLAQGIAPEEATVSAVYLHGLSGDIACKRLGRRYMQPTDLIDSFPEAFSRCGWE
jgi:NAD(P)H-hydrate epimerase